MKKILSILLVAVATLTLTSCHRDQLAIKKLNDVVTTFEQQYEQMTDEEVAQIEAQYTEALEEVAQYRYSQADNELIGSIKARFDKTVIKYELYKAKNGAEGIINQIIGYGKELIGALDSI